MTYIYLATSSFGIGALIVMITNAVCENLNIDVVQNIWILVFPVILTLIINVLLIELYNKIWK